MQTRIFKILVAVTILTGLIACQQKVQPLSAEMEKRINSLPAEADIVGYVNVARLQHAEFAGFLADSARHLMDSNEKYKEITSRTGIDPQKDVEEIYFAGTVPQQGDTPRGLVLVSGRFDVQKLQSFIREQDKKDKIVEQQIAGKTVFSSKQGKMALCIVNASTVVGGNPQLVTNWLNGGGGNSDLLAEVKPLQYKKGAWLVLRPQHLRERINVKKLKNMAVLQDLQKLSFSMDVDQNLRLTGSGRFGDTEKAKLLQDALKGFVATGKLSVSDDRDIIDLLNRIDIEAEDGVIRVNFKMNSEDLKMLYDKRKKLRAKVMKTV